MATLLDIKNLHAQINGKEILKGINLTIQEGEVHAVMGPNGAGKSTLSAVLSGNPNYEVTEGSITFMGQNFLELSPEERSWAGLFLSFQYPIEIPGVTIANFMKTAINEHRKAKGLEPLKAAEYLKMMREKMALVEMDPASPAKHRDLKRAVALNPLLLFGMAPSILSKNIYSQRYGLQYKVGI